jgi:hypothetical protein
MTLSALAEFEPPTASPNRTVAAASKELNELRMSLPETAPRNWCGVTLSRAEPLRQAHLLFSHVLRVSAAFALRCFARLRSDGLLEPIDASGGENAFGRPSWRRTQVLPGPRRDLPEFLRSMERPVRLAEHLAREQYQIGLIIADNLVFCDTKRRWTSGPDKIIDGRAA